MNKTDLVTVAYTVLVVIFVVLLTVVAHEVDVIGVMGG